ncbi:MAG: hypothetical protein MJK10_01185 [Pseudomonadales bacterium]|nr:hypothetical protein [Pseudomonadales bacterium]NRA14489.1 hypothetical protein [Oceanospirillaceae bacterium]
MRENLPAASLYETVTSVLLLGFALILDLQERTFVATPIALTVIAALLFFRVDAREDDVEVE